MALWRSFCVILESTRASVRSPQSQTPWTVLGVKRLSPPVRWRYSQKAFSGYFGKNNKAKWAEHDATELIKKYQGPKPDILIDVGTGDNFYKAGQLLPENFENAAKEAGLGDAITVRYQEVLFLYLLTLLIDRGMITVIISWVRLPRIMLNMPLNISNRVGIINTDHPCTNLNFVRNRPLRWRIPRKSNYISISL